MRYMMKFSYDGSNFNGYQIQPKLRTIQEELEKALSYINNQTKTVITSSGRTDKGVHALCQVAHFDLEVKITDNKLKRALNSLISQDIHVIKLEKTKPNFHARFMAKKKEYIYKLNVKEYDPLTRNYIYQYNQKLDFDKLTKALKEFEGTHDFTSFISSEDLRENKVRTIYQTKISFSNNIIIISFQADGFMKYQVRNMIGLLLEIGRGKKKVSDVKKIIEAKNRKLSFKTAPPEGLYLKKVWY